MTGKMGFEIKVVQGNAEKINADVLMLKYTQAWTTLTKRVVDKLPTDNPLRTRLPRPGQWLLTPSLGVVSARSLLVIGLPPRKEFDYNTLHDLSRLTLEALAEADSNIPIRHLAITLHGADWGFDEGEAFRAMLLGFVTAVENNAYPQSLEKISVVENHANRAKSLSALLEDFLTADDAGEEESERRSSHRASQHHSGPLVLTAETLEDAEPIATLDEPSIFVAMPFARKYDDIFYLALQPAVKEVEHQCIRLDQSSYTGDVIETIKDRIRKAHLMIALLDGINPNVFLEIGYAWGVGTPTVLVVNIEQSKDKDIGLPFDVRSQKYLVYELLYELKPKLTAELRGILKKSAPPKNSAKSGKRPTKQES